MELHTMKTAPGARRARKRLGRGMGSGTGKTAGKGHKGQMARKGHKRKLGFEGGQMPLIRRLPKRGFQNPNRKEYLPVNVGQLARFEAGTDVTPELLRRVGLANGTAAGIKILGVGSIDRALKVTADKFSASARAKIEAAGGSCEEGQQG